MKSTEDGARNSSTEKGRVVSHTGEEKQRNGSCPYRMGILFQSWSWAEWQRGSRTRTQRRNRVGGPQREQPCNSPQPRPGASAVNSLQKLDSLQWPQLHPGIRALEGAPPPPSSGPSPLPAPLLPGGSWVPISMLGLRWS